MYGQVQARVAVCGCPSWWGGTVWLQAAVKRCGAMLYLWGTIKDHHVSVHWANATARSLCAKSCGGLAQHDAASLVGFQLPHMLTHISVWRCCSTYDMPCFQMHACPVAGACTYENRTELLTVYQDLLTAGAINFAGSVVLSNESLYQDLLCAPGYTGNLCASECCICWHVCYFLQS